MISTNCVAKDLRLQLPSGFLFLINMYVPISKNTVISLVIGSIFGLSVSLLTKNIVWKMQNDKSQWSFNYKSDREIPNPSHGHAHSHKDLREAKGPEIIPEFHNKNDSFHKDEDLVARKLAEKVKVLCWISTHPGNHKEKVSYNIMFFEN